MSLLLLAIIYYQLKSVKAVEVIIKLDIGNRIGTYDNTKTIINKLITKRLYFQRKIVK